MSGKTDCVIVGGGAAGIFCAGLLRTLAPSLSVTVLEASNHLLKKVRISGGGRCNVTHALDKFKVSELCGQYPRGGKLMMSILGRFGIEGSHEWFNNHGVELKTEFDGRVFPVTDNSQTIIDALMHAAEGASIVKRAQVVDLYKEGSSFGVVAKFKDSDREESITTKYLILAGGSSLQLWKLANSKLHMSVENPVPSLFTLKLGDDPKLTELQGVSVSSATISLCGSSSTGPALITHFGLSGPAVLRQSAYAAFELAKCRYKAPVFIDWTGGQFSKDEVLKLLMRQREVHPARNVSTSCPLVGSDAKSVIPSRLWSHLCSSFHDEKWSCLSKQRASMIAENVVNYQAITTGKVTFKEEFVTAGGVSMDSVTKHLECKNTPGLFCIGEFLNIDGVTGGFNFTACWSTASAVAHRISTLENI